MSRSIVITVHNPYGSPAQIDGFTSFWAAYGTGYKPELHCQASFDGDIVISLVEKSATMTPLVFDLFGESNFLYVCGVAALNDEARRRDNFHLPLRYSEGASVSAVTHTGQLITATNAVVLQIPQLPTSWAGTDELQSRCKNYQFAVKYFSSDSQQAAERVVN
jgi:hypothetical protein